MNKSEIISILESRLARSKAYDEPISISSLEIEQIVKSLKNEGNNKVVKLPTKKYYSTSYGEVEVYSSFEIEEMLRKNNIIFNK